MKIPLKIRLIGHKFPYEKKKLISYPGKTKHLSYLRNIAATVVKNGLELELRMKKKHFQIN